MGWAYYTCYSRALGVDFLGGLQPAGYIFYGAQFLINLSILVAIVLLVGVLVALWVAQVGIPAIPNSRFAREPKYRLGVGLFTAGASFLLRLPLLASIAVTKTLITSNPCSWPIHTTATSWTSVWFVAFAVLGGVSFRYVRPSSLKWTFLVLCSAMSLLALYVLGHELGAASLYGNEFQIAEISISSPQSLPALRFLILGSDDKNMVVLLPSKQSGEKPQPTYLQRADLKSVRIVSSSGIRDFFCKLKSTANQ